MGKFTTVEHHGRITVITINRPQAMNALNPPTNFELAEAFDAFEADSEQWVAILTGAGDRAFSAGNDLKWHASAKEIEVPASGFGGLVFRLELDKPVIAAVNGVAMGGGFETALACDLLIAADHATFALPEGKVGLIAGGGGLQRLPRQIGLKHAMGMALTGRVVGAREGFTLGFVNEVVPRTALMEAAFRWANQIIDNSPLSVRATKQMIRHGLDEGSLAQALDKQLKYPAVTRLFSSNDYIEGPKAFAEKRKPVWDKP